jgi:hypothetical protein
MPAEPAAPAASDDSLNNLLSIVVALVATLLGLCNVKDGNIVQNMAKTQAEAIDTWSYYQAKSIKQSLAESTVAQLEIAQRGGAQVDAELKAWREREARYGKEKEELKAKAEGLEQRFEQLNYRDDQFDLAEAALSLSIALFGLTALVKRRLLLWVGAGFTAFGALYATAGFAGLPLNPGFLAALLS